MAGRIVGTTFTGISPGTTAIVTSAIGALLRRFSDLGGVLHPSLRRH